MNKMDEEQLLNEIVDALREKGFEPWEQIKGYVELGDDLYITRHKDARKKSKKSIIYI